MSGLADRGAPDREGLGRQVGALFGLLSNLYGPDKLVLKAGKLEALDGMQSSVLEEQVQALQKLVFEDPTIALPPSLDDVPRALEEIEDELADLLARRSVEDRIDKKIAERMQQRHEEYVKELRIQALKEAGSPETAQTLKRYATLEKMDQRRLTRSVIEILKPACLEEIVGQEQAVRALLAKIAAPFPQHVILYGPPGVGKTSAARLVLEAAKQIKHSPFGKDAPFVEVDGATLRWDPREITNPLLGSVHDPIYQGARRDLAEGGVPEPKLGLVTEAHTGVLFIDEIGEMDLFLQAKLLKVLEEKRVTFDSSYYDPSDPQVPKYIKKLFEEGAPADFVLVTATTRCPEDINPAVRSRCAEVFFEPLTPTEIVQIVHDAGRKLGVEFEKGVAELIADYTTEGRKAIGILADAYSLALLNRRKRSRLVLPQDAVREVVKCSRLIPNVNQKGYPGQEVGRVFAMAVTGYLGSILEVEAVVFPSREPGKGSLRFNDTAGTMARDSVFNALSVARRITGQDLANYDVHVNVVGGGRVDGPSAGTAILLAVVSALQGHPVRQDVAVTGEISLQGRVRPVGGLAEKLYGARQAGMKRAVIPSENLKEFPGDTHGLDLRGVSTAEELLPLVLVMPPAACEHSAPRAEAPRRRTRQSRRGPVPA
ncbi:MAG TPA: ATP-dependent protease, Lon family [Clostridiales bacterium]|nr:ATP-dependent protease, Lon family [Clostridiales bacterium]